MGMQIRKINDQSELGDQKINLVAVKSLVLMAACYSSV